MIYVALLRGINVGGKNKVEMARLREVFQREGLADVRTYINSGNVIFAESRKRATRLMSDLETAIEEQFGFPVKVLVKSLEQMEVITDAIPAAWVTDDSMRCDVMFLWQDHDRPGILSDLPVREGIDQVIYVAGAVIWQVDAINLTRSGRTKVIGGQMYKASTVRNANTTRKLTELMRQAE
jgi:uncharacterized protein (DUF1697 family)